MNKMSQVQSVCGHNKSLLYIYLNFWIDSFVGYKIVSVRTKKWWRSYPITIQFQPCGSTFTSLCSLCSHIQNMHNYIEYLIAIRTSIPITHAIWSSFFFNTLPLMDFWLYILVFLSHVNNDSSGVFSNQQEKDIFTLEQIWNNLNVWNFSRIS